MAQTTDGKAILYEMRAEQLAVVLLTRRHDLEVEMREYRNGYRYIDLLVNVRHEGRNLPRRFGVEIKAALDPSHRSGMVRQAVNQARHMQTMTIPYCLFFFAVRNDEGYYAWLIEPKIGENGDAYLALADNDHSARPALEPLDDQAIETIVRQVDHWYDVVYRKQRIVVPVSKSKFAKTVQGGNLKEIDVDESFPNWVEEIRQGVQRRAYPVTFDVIPLEGEKDEGKELITVDEGIAQDVLHVLDETELDVLRHWREWTVKLSPSRSRGLPYV